MSREITQTDYKALLSHDKKMYLNANLVEQKPPYKKLGSLDGCIISGNYSIDSDSDVRRTCNISVNLSNCTIDFTESTFFNCALQISIGYYSPISKDILWYEYGIYAFDKNSYRYDASTNQLDVSLGDLSQLMDSEHRGTQLGALRQIIYANDPDTGQRYTDPDKIVLKNIVTKIVKDYGVRDVSVEHIGTYKNNENSSLEEVPYGELPYDLEFSNGVGLLEILSTIRDLYPRYEFFFDIDGKFWFKSKPVTDKDPVVMDEKYINELVISESRNINIYDVKNVIEVWGKDLEPDRNAINKVDENSNIIEQHVSYDLNTGTYNLTLDNYTESGYVDNMTIAIKIPCTNTKLNTYISINGLQKKSIYHILNSETKIPKNSLMENKTYVFKYSLSKNAFYYIGMYQVHAVAVLSNGTTNINQFKTDYNCDNVALVVNRNSPFCVEKIGRIPKSFNDGDSNNIISDDLALSYAKYQVDQLSQRRDTISLEMIVVPWLDVNQKIKYIPQGETEAKEYLIKSISGDFLSGTMNVELIKFYKEIDD